MKKIVFSLIIVFLLTLSACRKTPTIEDPIIEEPIVCTENQVKTDDVCVDLSGAQIQIKTALENTSTLQNYRITSTIVENEISFEVISEFKENISKITTPNKVDYYRKNESVCEHLELFNDLSTQSTIACSENSNTLFIKELNYMWFEIQNGKYVIMDEYKTNLEQLISEAFFEASIESFELSVASDFLSEVNMVLLFATDSIALSMTIDHVNQVNITWIGEVN